MEQDTGYLLSSLTFNIVPFLSNAIKQEKYIMTIVKYEE